MKMTISEIAKAVGAEEGLIPDSYLKLEVTNVSFDSREVTPGSLFIPLVGENDGHDYVNSAIANGAIATLWAKDSVKPKPTTIAVLEVEDPLVSFQQLGKYYLTKINPRVIAVTGSNGKTTTKDMIAAILANSFNVTKTKDNFNNEIGVPYTLLQLDSNTDFLVVELGMDRPGQLEFLSNLVEPDVAVITMIGEAHIEFFGTRDKIADAKMEIVAGLKNDGFFVYNGDEPLLVSKAESVAEIKKTFGLSDQVDIYPTAVDLGQYQTKFKVNLWPEMEFTIPVIGEYNVNNALAAILVGNLFEIRPQEIASQLQNFDLTKNRTQWQMGLAGEQILNDVYNSNPTAAKEVIEAFTNTKRTGNKYIVLGDMLELGDQSAAMHASLATVIDSEQIAGVYLVGADIKALYDQLQTNFDNSRLHYYHKDQLGELTADLTDILQANDQVMLKASHGIHLENVVSQLAK